MLNRLVVNSACVCHCRLVVHTLRWCIGLDAFVNDDRLQESIGEMRKAAHHVSWRCLGVCRYSHMYRYMQFIIKMEEKILRNSRVKMKPSWD